MGDPPETSLHEPSVHLPLSGGVPTKLNPHFRPSTGLRGRQGRQGRAEQAEVKPVVRFVHPIHHPSALVQYRYCSSFASALPLSDCILLALFRDTSTTAFTIAHPCLSSTPYAYHTLAPTVATGHTSPPQPRLRDQRHRDKPKHGTTPWPRAQSSTNLYIPKKVDAASGLGRLHEHCRCPVRGMAPNC